jgi:hypothetical protein
MRNDVLADMFYDTELNENWNRESIGLGLSDRTIRPTSAGTGLSHFPPAMSGAPDTMVGVPKPLMHRFYLVLRQQGMS